MTTTPVAVAPTRVLNAQDRCDRCGAQALVAFQQPIVDLELLFCGHHSKANDNETVLKSKGFIVTADNRP